MVMKKNYCFSAAPLFFFLLCSIYSCFPGIYTADPFIVNDSRQKENVYHAPSAHNVPLLSNKNDLSFSANLAYTSKYKGVDIQSAYIPVNHLGLLANLRSYSQKSERHDGGINSFELGAGYLNDWNWVHLESYAGIGSGNVKNTHHTGSSSIKFTNYFIQPTIGVQNKQKTVQFAFSSKFNLASFKITDTAYAGEREPFVATQMKQLADYPDHVFWEPGFVFRTGWQNWLIQTAFSFSSDLSGHEFYRDKTNFSIGLVVRINTHTPSNGK